MTKPGLPKKYAKMGFKKGWKAFKASKRKTKSKKTSKPKPKTKTKKRATTRSTKTMGRRTRKIPLAATAGLVSSILPALSNLVAGNFEGAAQEFGYFAGATPGGFNFGVMAAKILPIIAGAGVSMAASKLGLNRYLSGIPFVKI